jgi:hypothetical protein
MSWNKIVSILACVTLTLLSACSLQMGPSVNTGTGPDPTAVIQTRVARLIASTNDVQTAIANAVESTLAAQNSPTPAPNVMLPTDPTKAVTASLAVPTVSVSVQTNCRSGPGTAYDILGILNVGQTAEMVGRSSSNDNWIIKLPSNPTVTCWLWGQYASVVGNTAGLPVVDPPPTPTPPASFDVAYSFTQACPIGTYPIQFQIYNSGGITWRSNRVVVTDLVTAETREITWNGFPAINNASCAVDSTAPALEPGWNGFTSSLALSANPAGDWISATIQVCSLDGLAGICMEKTIKFSP